MLKVCALLLLAALLEPASCTLLEGRSSGDEAHTHRQKVIIIADPGVDDAAAILMAVAHPEIEVLAVLSNFGVVSSTEAADNARIILNVISAATLSSLEIDGESSEVITKWQQYVPVYMGSDFSYGSLPTISTGDVLL